MHGIIDTIEPPQSPPDVGERLLCRQCDRKWRVMAVSLGEMSMVESESAPEFDAECSFCHRCASLEQAAAGMTFTRPVPTRRELRAALKEALDAWEHRSFRSKMIGGPGKSVDWERIAELRKLVGG